MPFLRSGAKEAFDLLAIDIDALAAIIDLLHLCYYKTGIVEEFPATLDQLAGVVHDDRWSAKMAYFRALWWLVYRAKGQRRTTRWSA